MAVVITRTANPLGSDGVGTTTKTYSGVDIGAADPSRIIAVTVGTELTGGTPSTTATIGGLAMTPGTLGNQAAMGTRCYYREYPTGTTADIAITYDASQGDTTQHIAVYRVIDGRVTGGSAIGDTDADPITSGGVTIPTSGGLLAIASMAADNVTRTWGGATEDIDDDAGTFQFTTAMSTTGGVATLTVSGANGEDGALSWLIFSPADRPPIGNKRRAAAMAAMLATAFIAPPPQPQVGAKFNPALFEVAAATPDEPPGGYSPKIVSLDDPHPPQRGAQIASLLEQPVVVADKTPYQRPPDVTLHWIPEYVSPQRLAYLTPPPVYLTPGNEDEPPGGSSPKVVSIDDPPLPQTGARLASILYEPPAVVADDPPFRYRRFQWGEGPAVVTEIDFGSIIEPVDLPPRFRPFQDTSLWQPGPPEPIVHKKIPNAFLHLLVEDNHEPPGGSSPKIVTVDDPPLPQVSGKIAAALFVPPVVDDPPRFRPFQDVAAWYVTVPLPTLNDKLNGSILDNEDDQGEDEDAQGGGWFVTGHLGKPRGGVVTRIIDDGETDDERRQRVFKEILGDLEQVVEDKKPVKVAQAVKAIKRIAKQAPQDTTRSDELIKALRRAEAARAEAERLEQLRIAMAIAHDIERALMAAAMLKYQNEQALIALLLAD
jgi:hypothetical protein